MKLFANDLGYSSVKGVIDGKSYHMPSVMAILRQQDLYDPTPLKDVDSDYLKNMVNHIDVTIQSPIVKQSGRILVGQAALDSHLSLTSLDVNDLQGKSEMDMSLILSLSLLASNILSEHYTKTGKIENCQADVFMATALPVLEGKQNDTLTKYRDKFKNHEHVVTFHNFDKLISVTINFSDVIVALEGETAQYRISSANDSFKKLLFDDFKKHYGTDLGISADDLVSATNTLHLDIGEGTTDIVVFENGRVNAHASSSLTKGYATALQGSIEDLQAKRLNINSIADLRELLHTKPTAMTRNRIKIAKDSVEEQLDSLAQAVLDGLSMSLKKLPNIEVIYVYGGGSIELERHLRTKLMEKTRNFAGGFDIPVVFINPKVAQFMNVTGLELIADKIMSAKNGGDK